MRLLLLLLAACSGTSEPPDDTDTVGDTEETDESDTLAETDPAETEESDPPETDDTDLPVDTTIPPALDGLNLLVNGDGESGDLTGWTLLDNGGDGWAVLQMNAHSGTWAFGTSYGLCRRQQVVDLLAAGFTEAQLDAEPRIDASEWYREHCNGPDPWSIEGRSARQRLQHRRLAALRRHHRRPPRRLRLHRRRLAGGRRQLHRLRPRRAVRRPSRRWPGRRVLVRPVRRLVRRRLDPREQPVASAQAPTPTGQPTPVPPIPQYPSGFFASDRYCWWKSSAK